MKTFVDGKQWAEDDYLTVNKNLHVKGDFTLDGTAVLNYDTGQFGTIKAHSLGLGTVCRTGALKVKGSATFLDRLNIVAGATGYQNPAGSAALGIQYPSGQAAVRLYSGTATVWEFNSDGDLISRLSSLHILQSLGKGAGLGTAISITPVGIYMTPTNQMCIGTLFPPVYSDLFVKGTAITNKLGLGWDPVITPFGSYSGGPYLPGARLDVRGTAYVRRLLAGNIQGTPKKLVQGGSAKPGSAGYIIFGRAFAAAPSAVLTEKDAWAPSVAYGPRIKRIAAGSMQAMGSPLGYAWWQAVGSAF